MTSSSPLSSPPPWNLVASEYAAEVAPIFAWFSQKAIDLAKLIEAFGEEGRSMQRKANLSVGRKRM
jgi:hypothetical protein